jgi:hypothetical protein
VWRVSRWSVNREWKHRRVEGRWTALTGESAGLTSLVQIRRIQIFGIVLDDTGIMWPVTSLVGWLEHYVTTLDQIQSLFSIENRGWLWGRGRDIFQATFSAFSWGVQGNPWSV